MTPRIEILKEKRLVGKRVTMSLANNRTVELWNNLMSHRREISNTVTHDLFSLQIYTPTYFTDFKPTNEFEKWATVEVADLENVPNGMESLRLEGGLYAVFDYKGLNTDPTIFQYIYGSWLPKSDYFLDNRPHFEVLGVKYKNNDPTSEEEIWIPIKSKS